MSKRGQARQAAQVNRQKQNAREAEAEAGSAAPPAAMPAETREAAALARTDSAQYAHRKRAARCPAARQRSTRSRTLRLCLNKEGKYRPAGMGSTRMMFKTQL
jgi:hypothetical protein